MSFWRKSVYELEFHEKVVDDIQYFPKEVRSSVFNAIKERLSLKPYNFNPLKGKKFRGLYRLRVADYRIVYTIDEKRQTVRILAIGHRSKIYKFLSRRI